MYKTKIYKGKPRKKKGKEEPCRWCDKIGKSIQGTRKHEMSRHPVEYARALAEQQRQAVGAEPEEPAMVEPVDLKPVDLERVEIEFKEEPVFNRIDTAAEVNKVIESLNIQAISLTQKIQEESDFISRRQVGLTALQHHLDHISQEREILTKTLESLQNKVVKEAPLKEELAHV